MSSETERRVENLLATAKGTEVVNNSSGPSSSEMKQSLHDSVSSKTEASFDDTAAKEKFSIELKNLQDSRKV